jgi:hypothetical protein
MSHSKDTGIRPKKVPVLPGIPSMTKWTETQSYIPKDLIEHQSPLQKFDQIHAKYLTSPRIEMPITKKREIVNTGMDKGLKKEKESFRTRMVNLVMYGNVTQVGR